MAISSGFGEQRSLRPRVAAMDLEEWGLKSMNLPFSLEQFLGVFVAYNTAIWPIQIVLNLLAAGVIVLCLRSEVSSRIIATLLAAFWVWTGIVYHVLFFSKINPAAFGFGLICIVQGSIFFIFGALKQGIAFRFQRSLRGYVGMLLLGYGLVIYPVLGYFLGHVYPSSPTFGAPCPTTIFTFGLMLWIANKVKVYMVVLPFVWSIIGFVAALKLGILEDVGLLVAGVLGTALLLTSREMELQ
jgi:hypothetical protein